MTQVLAISLDTEKVEMPETSSSRHSSIDFEKLYDQERSKIMFPFQMFNFSSNMTTALNSADNNTSDINIRSISQSGPASTDNMSAISKQDAQTSQINKAADDNKASANTSQNEIRPQAAPSNTARPDQALKYFVGELKIGSDMIDSLTSSGTGIGTIKKVDMEALISQIQDKIKMLKNNEKVELVVQLKPDGMGTISMSVTSNKGIVSINIFADQAAKKALEDGIQDLELALKNANVKFDKLIVSSLEKDLHGNSRHS